MKLPRSIRRELSDLLWSLNDGSFAPADVERLEQLAAQYPEVRRLYACFMAMCGILQWEHRDLDAEASAVATPSLPEPILPNNPSTTSFVAAPCLTLDSTHSAQPAFVGGALFSYLTAALILATALAVAATWKLPSHQPYDYAVSPHQSVLPADGRPLPCVPKETIVGQITGMVDCVLTNAEGRMMNGESQKDRIHPSSSITHHSPVRLGDHFRIRTGLMEITYDTGAKVILQGPVTYEVESAAGGYLAVGKLTAKLEKKEEPGTKNEERVASRSSLLVPNCSFAVRTPTAIVTDLGTEFGVEVTQTGDTTSRVFRGTIEVRPIACRKGANTEAKILQANQSARVERSIANRILVLEPSAKPTGFIRELPKQDAKTLDLVDVVAGGNGFTHERNRGIDATTGLFCNVPPKLRDIQGDYRYYRVNGLPLIDGVFIPDGSKGPVQIDSAGHVFSDCPKTDNRSWCCIWAGGPLNMGDNILMPATLDGVDYSSPEHAVLLMHANKGITFDLDAIRRENARHRILRFLATVGNTEVQSAKGLTVNADVWVLIDGRVCYRRSGINASNGGVPIAASIQDTDRFLTLITTDGDNGYTCDMVIFGDPRLELIKKKGSDRDGK